MPYTSHFHPSSNVPRQYYGYQHAYGYYPLPPPPPAMVAPRPPLPPPVRMARPFYPQQQQLPTEDPFCDPLSYAVFLAPPLEPSYAPEPVVVAPPPRSPSPPPPELDSPPPTFFYPMDALEEDPPSPPPVHAHSLDILKRRTRSATETVSASSAEPEQAVVAVSPPSSSGPPPGIVAGPTKPMPFIVAGLPMDITLLLSHPRAHHLIAALLDSLPDPECSLSSPVDKGAAPAQTLPGPTTLFLQLIRLQLDLACASTPSPAHERVTITLISIHSLFLLGAAREADGGERALDGAGEEDYLEELVEALVEAVTLGGGHGRWLFDDAVVEDHHPIISQETRDVFGFPVRSSFGTDGHPTPPLTPSTSVDSSVGEGGCLLSPSTTNTSLSTLTNTNTTAVLSTLLPLLFRVLKQLHTHLRRRLATSSFSAFWPSTSSFSSPTDPLSLSSPAIAQTRILVSVSYLLHILLPSTSVSPHLREALGGLKTIWTIASRGGGQDGVKRAFGVGLWVGRKRYLGKVRGWVLEEGKRELMGGQAGEVVGGSSTWLGGGKK